MKKTVTTTTYFCDCCTREVPENELPEACLLDQHQGESQRVWLELVCGSCMWGLNQAILAFRENPPLPGHPDTAKQVVLEATKVAP